MTFIGTNNTPWIGERTVVTSLEQLQTLDPKARLSVQKNKEGQDVLVATKGTLSDGLYSLWATFCPKQARQAWIETLTALKKTIAADFRIPDESIALRARNDEQTVAQDLKISRLLISSFEGKNWNNYFDFEKVKPSSNQLSEPATTDPTAGFSPLEKVLYKNQFQAETDKQNYKTRQAFVSNRNRLLRNIFNTKLTKEEKKGEEKKGSSPAAEVLAERKTAGALFTGSLGAVFSSQYSNPDNSQLSNFSQLKEAIENFRKENFSDKKSTPVLSDKFDRDLMNFLDQHPKISLAELKKYLAGYLTDTSSPGDAPRTNSTTSDPIEEIIRGNPTLTKTKALKQLTTISTYSDLSEQIAAARRTNNDQQFFELLKEISSPASSFLDSHFKEKVKLNQDERNIFIDHLLGAFTIEASNNRDVYQFLKTFGEVLAADKDQLEQQGKAIDYDKLKTDSLKLLDENKDAEQAVKTRSATIYERVLQHQEAEKKWKEESKTNPNAERPELLHEPYSEATEFIPLSNHAKNLLAYAIVNFCTPVAEQETTKATLRKNYGITFDDSSTSSTTTSPNSAVTTSEEKRLPLPAGAQEALQALKESLIKLAEQNPSKDFLKLEKTKSEMNRRIDNLLRSKPTASLEDISSCISKFESDLQNLIALDEARNP